MKIAAMISTGVEAMAAPEKKFRSEKIGDTWQTTTDQATRDGLYAWILRVAVPTGTDDRIREEVQVTVWSDHQPAVQDRQAVVFPDLDVRAFNGSGRDGRLAFSGHTVHVRDSLAKGEWALA